MRIEVNIGKKYFVVLASLLIALTGTILVYTYGGTSPSTAGHTIGELQCGNNKCDANGDGRIDLNNSESPPMPCPGKWKDLNAGEDIIPGKIEIYYGPWNSGADTCDGDKSVLSACPINRNGTCDDYSRIINSEVSDKYYKKTNTCKISKIWICD